MAFLHIDGRWVGAGDVKPRLTESALLAAEYGLIISKRRGMIMPESERPGIREPAAGSCLHVALVGVRNDGRGRTYRHAVVEHGEYDDPLGGPCDVQRSSSPSAAVSGGLQSQQ